MKEHREIMQARQCQLLFSDMRRSNLNNWWKIILCLPLVLLWASPDSGHLFNGFVLLLVPLIVIYFFLFRVNPAVHQIEIGGNAFEVRNFWETVGLFLVLLGVIFITVRENQPDYFILLYVLLLFSFALIHFKINKIS